MTAPIDVIFIDLDDTIYPADNGIWQGISDRINRYMIENVGLSPREAEVKRKQYLELYGTSLKGLIREYDVSPPEYLQFVHDLPLEDYLAPAPSIRRALNSLPQSKHIFTNASKAHARRVLAAMDLLDCFQSIIGIEALGLANKPHPDAYTKALRLAGDPDPDRCALVDDRAANLEPAAALGMLTILVGPPTDPPGFVVRSIRSIVDLPKAIAAGVPWRQDHG